MMRRFRHVIAVGCAVTGAITLVISGAVASPAATAAQAGTACWWRARIRRPARWSPRLPAATQVRVSVFAGRDQAGLTA